MTSDAATVREALEFGRDCGSRSGEGKIMRDALAALDRLVAELRECRKAFKIGHSTLMRMQARAEKAEAERDRLLTATEPTRAGVQRRDGGAMMAFAGPSNHMCKCFGEGDGRDGSWRPCPPDLCEADVLVEAAAAREERLAELEAELDEALKSLDIEVRTSELLVARAEAAEAERDEARRIALSLGDQLTDAVDRRAAAEAANEATKQFSYASHRQRAEAAEAERDRARESLVSQIAYRSAAEARIKELQVALDCISGSALVEAKEAAEAEVARLREALSMLRDAWNAHMATCPHHNALPDFMRPTPADVQSWIDAPSNTASARAALGETT